MAQTVFGVCKSIAEKALEYNQHRSEQLQVINDRIRANWEIEDPDNRYTEEDKIESAAGTVQYEFCNDSLRNSLHLWQRIR